MKFLTANEVSLWCSTKGLQVNSSRFLSNPSETLSSFSISLEDKASNVIALADYLVPTWPDIPFAGALFWIRERGVWGDSSENTGAMLLQQMRAAQGELRPLGEFRGTLFAPDELVEFHSYFLLPMLFGWDAFAVLEGEDYFFFVSHDGYVEVVSHSVGALEKVRLRTKDWTSKSITHYAKLANL